ncbi:alpha/beta hydrolase [soil metagenome]
MLFENFSNEKFSWKRWALQIAIIPVFLYVGLGIFAYFFADRMIFQPQKYLLPANDSTLKLSTPNGEKISAIFFKNPNAEYTILFSHGNAENIFTSEYFSQKLSNAGFNVLAYDYRGYGLSEGKPSEQNSYEDAETAYNYLVNDLKITPEKIIIFGRSLGGAVSIDLASRKKCGGLIAESTFVSAFRVMTVYKIYPFDEFENLKKIPKVNCPLLLIHGKKDELIPIWQGEKLFSAATEPKYFFQVEEGGHGTVAAFAGDAYFQKIVDFADNLPK